MFTGFVRTIILYLLIIVGNEEIVAAMVSNDRQTRRYSGLKLRLQQKGQVRAG